MRTRIFINLLIVFLLSACNGTPTASVLSTPSGNAYPILSDSQNATSDAYPGPLTEAQTRIYAENELPPLPNNVPIPQQGKGSISGVLFSVRNRRVIPDTMFYLTPGWGENRDEQPQMLIGPREGDFKGTSDANGYVQLDDIEPGYYFIVMAAFPQDWEFAYPDANTQIPLRIEIKQGSQFNLGVLFIHWP